MVQVNSKRIYSTWAVTVKRSYQNEMLHCVSATAETVEIGLVPGRLTAEP